MYQTQQILASWLLDGILYIIRETRAITGPSTLTIQVIEDPEWHR